MKIVYKWFNEFKFGKINLEDELRSGRPPTAVTQEKNELVRFLLREDRRITYQQLEKSVGIGSAAINTIIDDHLNTENFLEDGYLTRNYHLQTKVLNEEIPLHAFK
ncbi:hypothetical protein LAZ67_X004093 [Cordylochernes scorpioides]|uniref:Transposase n=1 Tax=Cordylochernes scorpioides TaxID=51811 RepID=A0ABY6LUM4_9ARAC|nr:hypothetical protein LAZ67_X004093 [Cordylochernes scorpioides]